MKTFFLQVLGLVILVVVGLMISTNSGFTRPFLNFFQAGNGNPTNVLIITDETGGVTKAEINIELAETSEAKAKGLGGRESLGSNSGMLFVYEKADKYRFWMKGMQIPLDFIWIRGETVVDLLPNIPPPDLGVADSSLPLYTSVTEADKVLEVNAGFIELHNIILGDKIKY